MPDPVPSVVLAKHRFNHLSHLVARQKWSEAYKMLCYWSASNSYQPSMLLTYVCPEAFPIRELQTSTEHLPELRSGTSWRLNTLNCSHTHISKNKSEPFLSPDSQSVTLHTYSHYISRPMIRTWKLKLSAGISTSFKSHSIHVSKWDIALVRIKSTLQSRSSWECTSLLKPQQFLFYHYSRKVAW